VSPVCIGLLCYVAIACTSSALAVALLYPVHTRRSFYLFCTLSGTAMVALTILVRAYASA
jgi:hypothetical protein